MQKLTDLDYLRQAYQAATNSLDPSTQNGAILVYPDGHPLGGYVVVKECNRFPNGVLTHKEDRWIRPRKYSYIEHAERNAVYAAARRSIGTGGLIMYCPWAACPDCARAIIQAGITELVTHDWELHKTQVSWQESIRIAQTMLNEAGVKCRAVQGKIGGVKIRFNGELVEP